MHSPRRALRLFKTLMNESVQSITKVSGVLAVASNRRSSGEQPATGSASSVYCSVVNVISAATEVWQVQEGVRKYKHAKAEER